MTYFVQKSDFYDNTNMWADIANELVTNGGFKLISVDGQTTAPSIDLTKGFAICVLEATTAVDLLATTQPWRLCIKVTDSNTRLYAATPTQIQDDGTLAIAHTNTLVGGSGGNQMFTYPIYAGCIGDYAFTTVGGTNQNYYMPTLDDATPMFYSKGSYKARKTGSSNADLIDPGTFNNFYTSDFRFMPFSYCLSVSGHGIAFASWIEGQDISGNSQNWFVIQRAINSDGSVVTTGKAPLFCVYSVNSDSIRRFTVREFDVNAPAGDVDATIDTPDATRVINNKEQVSFNEAGRYDFKFPQGFNTARYSYAYQIDMIAYTSADVCSQRLDVQVQVYNEVDAQGNPKLRTYRALAANGPRNTLMRVFMLNPSV